MATTNYAVKESDCDRIDAGTGDQDANGVDVDRDLDPSVEIDRYVANDDRVFHSTELFPYHFAKFMELCSGMISFGKNGKVVVARYYIFWTIMNFILANNVACMVYVAGADPVFAFVTGLFYVPCMMSGAIPELKMLKSTYVGSVLSNAEKRKKLRDDFVGQFIFQTVTFLGVFWALPAFFVVLPFMQDNALSLWLNIAFHSFMYATPPCIIIMLLNMMWYNILELHREELISRIKLSSKCMLFVLKSETVLGVDARKRLQRVHMQLVSEVQREVRSQGVQMSAMLAFVVWFIVIVLYLVVVPLDPRRSQTTAGQAMRFIIYGLGAANLLSLFFGGLHAAAIPNNLWHDFTDAVQKDPHVLLLAVDKFGGKPELLDRWLEKNMITFRLFGVSIDRYLPGKMFAGLASVVISAGFIVARVTGTI